MSLPGGWSFLGFFFSFGQHATDTHTSYFDWLKALGLSLSLLLKQFPLLFL